MTALTLLLFERGSHRAAQSAARLLPAGVTRLIRPAAAAVLASSLLMTNFSGMATVGHATEAPPVEAVLTHIGPDPIESSDPTQPEPDSQTSTPPTSTPSTSTPPRPVLTNVGPAPELHREHVPLTTPHQDQTSEALATARYVVEPGDNFWSLATRIVKASNPAASNLEIAKYWLKLIEINRSRLPDPRNPDLIYPKLTLLIPRP